MQAKTVLLVLAGVLTTLAFAVFSAMIRTTQWVWLQSRAFGLLSYAALFFSVTLGEWRMLSKGKSEFRLFRLHKPVSVFALYLVLLHFISAVLDDFKWGKSLTLIQYLGFSFQDKWLALLSLGTLAFYLMVVLALTSSSKGIRAVGFRRWKLVHYLSYAAFFLAYLHSVNLGTDVKTSALAPLLSPLMALSGATVAGLLLTRAVNAVGVFSDHLEVGLAAVFLILLLALGGLTASAFIHFEDRVTALENHKAILEEAAVLSGIGRIGLNESVAVGMKEVENGTNT